MCEKQYLNVSGFIALHICGLILVMVELFCTGAGSNCRLPSAENNAV